MSRTKELVPNTGDIGVQQQLEKRKKEDAEFNAQHLREGESYDISALADVVIMMRDEICSRSMVMGRALFLVRQKETKSAYQGFLNHVKVEYASAQRLCRVYEKFKGGKRSALTEQLGSSMLLELMTQTDEDLDALADGGELAGMDKDDFLSLPISEVRAQLRKARLKLAEEKQTTDELVSNRDERIKQLQRAQKLGPKYSGLIDELIGDMASATAAITSNVLMLQERFAQFGELEEVSKEHSAIVLDMVKRAESVASGLIGIAS